MSLIFDFSTFEDDTLISDNDVVSNSARVESAIRAYSTVVANCQFGKLTGWKRRGSMQHGVVSNAREVSDVNSVYISPDDSIVPDRGKSLELYLTNDGGVWCDPILLSSWLKIV